MMSVTISPIAGTELRIAPGPWPVPPALRDAVPAVWAELKARNPHVWDGRILGFSTPEIGPDRILRARAYEDAYSLFLTWREAGFPPIGLSHIFGTALIVAADGALLVGVMGGETMNAGLVYPPGGSLEPRDVTPDGAVDVDACIATELMEETGLDIADARIGRLLAISNGPRLSICRALHFDLPAAALQRQITAVLEQQETRELDAIVVCRSTEDARAAGKLVPYAEALLDAVFAGQVVL